MSRRSRETAGSRVARASLSRARRRYGSLFDEAMKSVEKRKVKKYVFSPSGEEAWIVVGRKKEYLVMPRANFCSCDDFFFKVMDNVRSYCYHILAVRLARRTGKFEVVEEEDKFYPKFVNEWKA